LNIGHYENNNMNKVKRTSWHYAAASTLASFITLGLFMLYGHIHWHILHRNYHNMTKPGWIRILYGTAKYDMGLPKQKLAGLKLDYHKQPCKEGKKLFRQKLFLQCQSQIKVDSKSMTLHDSVIRRYLLCHNQHLADGSYM